MELTDDNLAALLKPLIPRERADTAVVYLDTRSRSAGESIPVGAGGYRMPFSGYFVFVDLMPAANWGHPALCIFVSRTDKRVQAVEVEFPPFFGDIPENYRRLPL